jgi:single-strand DNA-binding protein
MAAGLNRVQLIGNVGADPDYRMGQQGDAILKIRLATTESFQGRNGERQERTDWHSLTIFGKRAETLSQMIHKGSRLFAEGKLQTSSYEKDGQKIYRTDVVVSNVILLDGRPQEGEGVASTRQPTQARTTNEASRPVQSRAEMATKRQADAYGPADIDDSDIPF